MAYGSVPITSFSGGINLRDNIDELEPGQAYDLNNVTFTERGAVKSRPGYEPFAPTTTLNGAISAGASTITVVSTADFESAGTFQIGTTVVTYTGKTSTTFTGCTSAPAAATGTSVYGLSVYRPDNMAAYTDGSAWQMAVSMTDGTNRRLEVRNASGAVVGTPLTSPTLAASPNFFTRFGGGTASGNTRATPTLWASNGTDQLRVWTGSGTWSTPSWVITNSAPNPTGMFCAVTPWDNRLVNARYAPSVNPNQGGQNKNTVRFSSPTNPLAWDGFEYVDLTPGDGEEIMGMVTWGSYVFVFKKTRFFVFYGTSLGSNSLGVPDFNFRTIDAGVGLAAPQSLCVAPDGVYFLSEKGVYRTDGGPPQLVSGLLDPLFTGDLPPLYGGGAINYSAISKACMAFHRQQIYVAVPTGGSSTNNTMLVFDPRFGWWTIWDIAASAIAPIQLSTIGGSLVFAQASGNLLSGRLSQAATTDAGVAFTSRIKYGFQDYGSTVDKTIRESQVWGLGKFRYGIARNLQGSRNAATVDLGRATDVWANGGVGSDTWGPDPNYPNDVWSSGQAADFALVRRAVRGINFSVEISDSGDATPGAWTINRIVQRIRESRVPSVTKLDK